MSGDGEPNPTLHRTAAHSGFAAPVAGCAAGALFRSAKEPRRERIVDVPHRESLMIEEDWLACEDIGALLDHLRKLNRWQGIVFSERKFRLLACAFCRRIWHLLPDELSRATVELCEYYVDGLADPQPLWARGGFSTGVPEHIYDEGTVEREAYFAARFVGCQMEIVTGPAACSAEEAAVGAAARFATRATVLSGEAAEESARGQCRIIRDVIGNPFRRAVHNPAYREGACATLVRYQLAPLDPSWRTDTARLLAGQMYESRDFSAMPILADALQDAGCSRADVLDHCRGPGPHVRGCWVVDLVLGKE